MRVLEAGQTIQQVIDTIAKLNGADIDQLSLYGIFLDPDQKFDDYHESKNQLFIFSKATASSRLPSPPPAAPPPSISHAGGQPTPAYVRNFRGLREVGVLGKGAFSIVKLFEDSSTRDLIAVKIFDSEATQALSGSSAFFQEIDALIVLTHPCVLRIVEYCLATRVFPAQIGTEFATGGSLQEALMRLDDTAKAIAVVGVVLGMKFTHSRGVLHRDLKPANVLLDERSHPKIGDLRSSRFCDLRLTMMSSVGTPLYMAPEMYHPGEYTTAVDVYSFSLIVDGVFVGVLVFDAAVGPYVLMN
jgi:hypothetical protein